MKIQNYWARIVAFIVGWLVGLGSANFVWAQSPVLPDTAQRRAAQDTTPKKQVKRLTLQVFPRYIRYGHNHLSDGRNYFADTVSFNLNQLTLWDEPDTVQGFNQTLGMGGKPYRQYRYGLSGRYFDDNQYQNPATQEPDAYMAGAETQLPSFDTRTPYIELDFDQPYSGTQQFRGVISQNIGPFWNATLLFRSRNANGNGLFNNLTQQHRTMGARLQYRAFSQRFLWDVYVLNNDLQDFMNGGAVLTNPVQEERIYSAATARSWLSATLTRRSFTTGSMAVLRILNDSSHRLEALAEVKFHRHFQGYNDSKSNAADLFRADSVRYYPYPRYLSTWDTLAQSYQLSTLSAFGGARYRMKLGKFQWLNQGEMEISHTDILGMNNGKAQIRNELRYFSTLSLPGEKKLLYVFSDFRQANSTLLPSEVGWTVTGKIAFPLRRYTLADSLGMEPYAKRLKKLMKKPVRVSGVYYPLEVSARFQTATKNPSLYERYGQGATFVGNASLGNEKIFHLRATVKYTGKPKMRRALPFLQNYATLTAFATQRNAPIYFDTLAQVLQAANASFLRWTGLEIGFRWRVSRFYLENQTTLQTSQTNAETLSPTAKSLPNVYGKASLFWETRVPKTPLRLQMGIDCQYFTGYQALAFDPASQLFYPNAADAVRPFARFDVVVGGEIRSAFVYFKVTNVLDKALAPGYVTTPFYPMFPRLIGFGFVWKFFD